MKFWPFGNKLETRDDSYTDTLIAALVSPRPGWTSCPILFYNAHPYRRSSPVWVNRFSPVPVMLAGTGEPYTYYYANHGGPAVQYGYHPESHVQPRSRPFPCPKAGLTAS